MGFWKDIIRVEEFMEFSFEKEGCHFFKEGRGEFFEVQGVVSGSMRFTRKAGGIKAEGVMSFTISMPCSRCLKVFKVDVERNVDVFFSEEGVKVRRVGEEIELTKGDLDVEFLEDKGIINLKNLVEEEIRLSLPMKPLCSEECKGICPICGKDLNIESCTCKSEEIDPRLAPLLELKKKLIGGL